jgi:hypothetical protein
MKLLKTDKGHAAFNTRSDRLTSLQRNAFILFDGVKTESDVLATMAPLGLKQSDLDTMLDMGFLVPVRPKEAFVAKPTNNQAPAAMTDQERYLLAKPLATQLTATLGILGFRLNLAVESASDATDLLVLLPKIQSAVGVQECQELERLLKG